MLVVEAREIGRGRLLAVDPDVLDRGRAGPEAIFVHRICLRLRHCRLKVSTTICDSIGLTKVGGAHRPVFNDSDESSETKCRLSQSTGPETLCRIRPRRLVCLFGGGEKENG